MSLRAMPPRATLAASTLAALLCGCHPTPQPAAPHAAPSPPRDVAVLEAPAPDAAVDATASAPAPDAATPSVFFVGEAPLAPGCFAWSSSLASAACVIESPTDDPPNVRPVLRFTADAPGEVAALVDAAAFEAERELRPSPALLDAARLRLAREGYAPIEGLRQALRLDATLTWAPGATARWQRRTTARVRPNQARRYTDRVTIRWDGASAPLVLTALDDRPVEAPRITVYVPDGGRHLVVDYVGRYADEGEYGTHARAWRCDREARACVAQ